MKLYLTREEEMRYSSIEKAIFKDEFEALSEIEDNEIQLDNIYAYFNDNCIEVHSYIRSSLKSDICFGKVKFNLVDKYDNLIAEKEMNMNKFGVLSSLGGRVLKLFFKKEEIYNKNFEGKVELRFSSSAEIAKVVDSELDNLPCDIDISEKVHIEEYLKSLSPLKVNEISIEAYKLIQKDEEIQIIFIIRNGKDSPIKIGVLPVWIVDHNGSIIGGGNYDMDNISVSSKKANIYKLAIKSDNIYNRNSHLNKCKIYFKDIREGSLV